MSAAALRVNEATVFATGRGADWWALYRQRAEAADRVTVITASIGGDMVEVACDSPMDADWLRDHMVERQGLPSAAVRVIRLAKDTAR